MARSRTAKVDRNTKETQIAVTVNLDGSGRAEVATGVPLMPEFSHLSNPLDLTWAGLYDARVAEGCALALGRADPC